MSTSKIFLWNTIMNLLASPVRLGLNIYLASCLLPKDFGAVVIPLVIISLSDVLIDAGFKASLIQKSTLKNSHCSTIFFSNLLASVGLFLFFLLLAFPLQSYFQIPNLAVLIIIASFSLIIRSLGMVTEARLQIRGKYGQLIFTESLSYFVAYGVGIYLAKKGYGPFSLIIMSLLSEIGYNLGMYKIEKFVPSFKLVSKKLLALHWRMGKNLFGQGLLETFSNKVDEIILGKFININKLGTYSKGREYSNTLGVVGSKFFARPWFSVMSKHSLNKQFFVNRYRFAYLILVTSGFCLIAGNYLLGGPFIIHVMGRQWVGLVYPFKFFMISTAMYYLITFNKYTVLALGKPEVNFRIESMYSMFRITMLICIFLFFQRSAVLIYLLISTDVLSRLLMVTVQSYSLSKILYHDLKLFVNGAMLLVIITGVLSLIQNISYIYLGVYLVSVLVIMSYVMYKNYKIALNKA
ncbi:oligosaccharide flippase family protein [Mucilaginibacter ximonensis]|uniref:Oligosaccharide flippase family protein n=1 Tax=Mucilaginibacter ximonensis TaxID=538021 RepID=A0ABW5YCG9_9SPHI